MEIKTELNVEALSNDSLGTYSQTFAIFDGTYTTTELESGGFERKITYD